MNECSTSKSATSENEVKPIVKKMKKKQADVSNIYAMHFHRKQAQSYLAARARRAEEHLRKQDATLAKLIIIAKRVHLQVQIRNEALQWLMLKAGLAAAIVIICFIL